MGYSIEREVRDFLNTMRTTDWLKPIKKTPWERLREVFSNSDNRRTIFMVTIAALAGATLATVIKHMRSNNDKTLTSNPFL